MLLEANLANTKWCKKAENDWNPDKCVLIWKYSARAFKWIPTWHGFDGFQKSLHSCASDESSLSIERVNKHNHLYSEIFLEGASQQTLFLAFWTFLTSLRKSKCFYTFLSEAVKNHILNHIFTATGRILIVSKYLNTLHYQFKARNRSSVQSGMVQQKTKERVRARSSHEVRLYGRLPIPLLVNFFLTCYLHLRLNGEMWYEWKWHLLL